MEDSTSLMQIQAEVDLIKSMYGGEVEDLREQGLSSQEQQYRTTSVRLHLTPLQTHSEQRPDTHIMCIVKLDTDNEYPHSPVQFVIEDYKGITVQEEQELHALLETETLKAAKEGLVVFYEVCKLVKDYLAEHSRPDRPSVYDEMMARKLAEQQQQEQEQDEQQQLKLQQRQMRGRQLEEENAVYLDERLADRRSAAQSRDRSSALRHSLSEGQESPRRTRNSNSFTDSSSCFTGNSLTMSRFSKEDKVIRIVQPISESDDSPHSTYHVVDSTTLASSVLHTWAVKLKTTPARKRVRNAKSQQEIKLAEFLNRLDSIQKEMPSLMKLSSEYVVEYEGFKIVRTDSEIKVHLLQQRAEGVSLSHYLKIRVNVKEGHLRSIARGILLSLSYLHRNNVVHRDLKDSNIYYNSSQTDVYRIADYSIEWRLLEAIMNFNNKEPQFVYPMSQGKGGQKRDIFRLGVILISLCRGKRMDKFTPDIPRHLSRHFCHFLECCLHSDDSLRWSAEQLLGHELFSETASVGALEDASDDERQFTVDNIAADNLQRKQQRDGRAGRKLDAAAEDDAAGDDSIHAKSRLKEDYDMITEIGRGGFGRVYEVKNLMDGHKYAVKRISLKHQSIGSSQRLLREVQCLSRLSHEHIVRYFTSWMEEITMSTGNESSTDSDSESSFACQSSESTSASQEKFSSMDCRGDMNDYVSDDDDDYADDSVVFVDSGKGSPGQPSLCVKSPNAEKKDGGKFVAFQLDKRYLLIQMEFCENRTLRQAIDEGLYEQTTRMWRLFREMVRGLDYIHSQNLIHRDLKPGNIFIDSHDHVKIGDFGLATVAKIFINPDKMGLQGDQSAANAGESATGPSANLGTFFYIAPETANAPSKTRYTTKFDIYSLGIIFFEMVCIHPQSGHERIEILSKVRKPDIQLPVEFQDIGYANKKEVVVWLLNHKAENRPTTNELLKSDLLPPLSTEEEKFKEKLETTLEKYNSDVYLSILRNFFVPKELAIKELSFMHLNKPSKILGPKEMDLVSQQVEHVFRAHGGIWIPAPLFVPKGSFYSEKDFKKPYNVVSDTGNPMSCCPELRYPFARLVAIQDLNNVRRFCIDRVQSPAKYYTDFPQCRYECAFDFIGQPWEKVEFCARIMRLGQDIIKHVTNNNRNLNSSISIDVAHLPLAEVILTSCGVARSSHRKVLAIIKAGLRDDKSADLICQDIMETGISEKICRALKRYIRMSGSVEDVLKLLREKGVPHKRNIAEFESIVTEIGNIMVAANTMGVEYKILCRPLLVPDGSLFCGFSCQFIVSVFRNNKKKLTKTFLAQGGVFDSLILQHREILPPSQVGKKPLSAVGISFSLETLVTTVLPCTESRVSSLMTPQNFGCGGTDVTVLVAYVGEDAANTTAKLRERVETVNALRKNNITADFAVFMSEHDLHQCVSPFLVILSERSDKFLIKYGWNERFWAYEKRVSEADAVECLLSLLATDQEKGPFNALPAVAGTADESIIFETIHRKTNKQKESLRSDDQSRREREVAILMSRWSCSYKGCQVMVYCLELEKDLMLQLATLDHESTYKNYMDSLTDLKDRLRIDKDVIEYIEKCAKVIYHKINGKKSNDRSVCIIAYSIPSETYKRIY